jgi:hypothetical protein
MKNKYRIRRARNGHSYVIHKDFGILSDSKSIYYIIIEKTLTKEFDMLNLKKTVLFGVAGLVAFSMSCSEDSETTNPGGSVELDVDEEPGTYLLTGRVSASASNTNEILTLTFTLDDDLENSGCLSTGTTFADYKESGGNLETLDISELGVRIDQNTVKNVVCASSTGVPCVGITATATFKVGDPVKTKRYFAVACANQDISGPDFSDHCK